MITIATNMAGRGTDIVLGGNPEPELERIRSDSDLSDAARDERIAEVQGEWQQLHEEVLKQGGLHIIGTERHESRRVDNQLRGRAGRQGDAGSSRFYLSLEDPLLRIFASDRVAGIMQKLNMPQGEAIEHPWVTRAIENAQRKVEARNFDIRKQLLEYDDVANDQRKVIYQQRNEILESQDISETITAMRVDMLRNLMATHVPPQSVEEEWDVPGLEKALSAEYQLPLPVHEWLEQDPTCMRKTCTSELSRRRTSNILARWIRWGWTSCISTSGPSCCKAWTRTGANTSPRWIIYARASICGDMRKKTPNRNTSARRLSSLRACLRRSRQRSPGYS